MSESTPHNNIIIISSILGQNNNLSMDFTTKLSAFSNTREKSRGDKKKPCHTPLSKNNEYI